VSKNLIAAIAAATLLAACAPEKPKTKAATPVRVAAASALETPRGHRYSATLQPESQVSVSFRSSGYVDWIRRVGGRLLQAGDRVEKGTELARVRQEDTGARLAQARAALAEAQAGAERPRLDAERAETLYAKKSLTKPELDAARAGTRLAEARVEAAAAQLASANAAHSDTRLVAPLSGLVLSRSIEEGTLAAPGLTGFVLADVATMKAVFGVPDVVVQTVRIGDPIAVSAEAVPGVLFDGRVTAISPSADPTSRVFDVEVTIPNAGGRLKTGMVAGVEVQSKDHLEIAAAGASSVPLSAVLKSPKGEGYAVFVVDGAEGAAVARAREVKLGGIAGNQVAVLEGLKKGEPVVVTGAALLTDGESVRVIP
jgi:multidrug efflux system membrane fusion protein